MDNKKIGKLIASLRKKQELTQQELGDKVGVGFRAVSKWERGITLPDISIINELSQILGISSDELLSGELKKDNQVQTKKKLPTKITITISILTVFIFILTTLFIYYNNKTYVYDIKQPDGADYYIEGQVTFAKDKTSIIVNKLKFKEKNYSSTLIKNYDYKVMLDDTMIFGYGTDPNGNNIEEEITIEEMASNFRINYSIESIITRKEFITKKMYILFIFMDKNDQEIIKKIEIILVQ